MAVIGSSTHRQSLFLDDDISASFDVDPRVAASAAQAAYGLDATLAVAWCALSAKMDGRASDGHFWFEVFSLLRCAGAEQVDHNVSAAADLKRHSTSPDKS